MSQIIDQGGYTKEVTKEFFRSVYTFMLVALGISGAVAYWAGTPEFFAKYFVTITAEGFSMSPLFYVVAFAPVGLGLLIQMAYRRLSFGVLLALFMAYAGLMGLSLSTVLLAYSGESVAITFFVTAGAFGAMAFLGYTTNTDLTKFGSLMYMGFIGIFIAGIVNWFVGSDMISYIISIVGVFVFTGLTAYYMQQLKSTAENHALEGVERNKLALVGGLVLYILFINLFLSILRLLGSNE